MNQTNGRLELKQMYNKEFYELVEKYDLSIPQAEGFLTAYIALDRQDSSNGGIKYYTGSHLGKIFKHMKIGKKCKMGWERSEEVQTGAK